MCEVKVESRTRVTEHGRRIFYEKAYRGLLLPDGTLRLLAYGEKRMPLDRASAVDRGRTEQNLKGAA